VFFVIEVGIGYAHIHGATANPDGPWTAQQAGNLVSELADHARDFRFLIKGRPASSAPPPMPCSPMPASAS
jgi:putative transposase